MLRARSVLIGLLLFFSTASLVTMLAKLPSTYFVSMVQVTPAEVSPGETATVTGYQLDSAHVAGVYLNDGRSHYKVEILAQTESTIQFRVPMSVPCGRMNLAAMKTGRREMVEQPVYLTVTMFIAR
jgi:hypothetical protein